MKRDFSRPIVNFDGQQMTGDGKPATVATTAITALMVPEDGMTVNEKMRRYDLAKRIHAATKDQVEVSAEELGLISRLVGMHFPAMVVGQVVPYLDGGEE